MKIGEFITALLALRDAEGDLDVLLYDSEHGLSPLEGLMVENVNRSTSGDYRYPRLTSDVTNAKAVTLL